MGLAMVRAGPKRKAILDFMWSFGRIKGLCMFKKDQTHLQRDIFMQKPTSALIIAVLAGVIGTALILVTLVTSGLGDFWKKVEDSTIWLASVFALQGEGAVGVGNNKVMSSIAIVSIFASFMAYNIYTANMASKIATMEQSITSVEDLMEMDFKVSQSSLECRF